MSEEQALQGEQVDEGDAARQPRDVDRPPFIDGPDAFAALTAPPMELAGLYAYAHLDCLIDLARLVAADFFRRPHLYTDLDDPDIAQALGRFDARYGHDERFLSREQRLAILTPLFGEEARSGDGNFARLRDGMLNAAAAFAEWAQATGIPMLRERVRTAHRPLKEYLSGLRGASVSWSRFRAFPAVADEMAYRILSDRSVIAVFGVTRGPSAAWPYIEDSNANKVVEEVARRLQPDASPPITRESFSARQRVALRGAEALAAVFSFREGADDTALSELVTRCYSWHAALEAWRTPGATVGTRDGRRV